MAPEQSDFDKLRRLPFLYGYQCFTGAAVLCTVGAPMVLFGAELGLSRDQIGLLGGMLPFFQILGVACLPLILRFGTKKVAANALIARYFFLLPFLAAPLVSVQLAFWLMLASVIGYAICRTLSEAAVTPWSQEFIPRPLRGMISGRMALIYLPVALVISYLVQLWLNAVEGTQGFYAVFLVGIGIGTLGGALLYGLGGGAAKPDRRRLKDALGALKTPLKDRNFQAFLVSSGLQYLVFQALGIYLVLFFREHFGLGAGQLVLLAALIPLGSAAGSVIAGWFVDRSGTRGIRLSLQALQILLLLLLPLVSRDFFAPSLWAGTVFFAYGMLVQGAIVAGDIYMLNYVPETQRESYMALAYSSDGLFGGVLTVLAGVMVQWLETHPLFLGPLRVGGYELLFALCTLCIIASLWLFSRLQEEGAVDLRSFLTQVSGGNPLHALWGIRSYGSLNSEEKRRELAHNFAGIGSGLATSELLSALSDPSFDVRHEAIRALAHVPPSARSVQALENVLTHHGLIELQYAALETLGRLKARSSAEKMRPFLEDPSALLRARAARALGEMQDRESLALLRQLLEGDLELDVRLAAVSALGKLRDRESLSALAQFYYDLARDERAAANEPRSHVILLSISKILAIEERFSQIWRSEMRLPGYGLPEALARLAAVAPSSVAKAALEIASLSGSLQRRSAFELLRQVDLSRSPDAAALLRATDDLPAPHSALVILLTLAAARALKV